MSGFGQRRTFSNTQESNAYSSGGRLLTDVIRGGGEMGLACCTAAAETMLQIPN